MPASRILILAGTGEARELANALHARGGEVISCFAGVTAQPLLPQGRIRMGGFGGVSGLASFLAEQGISHVVDATHPFSAQMSRNAHAATTQTGVPLLRLERPPWTAAPGDQWITVQSVAEAADVLPAGARVLLTTGKKDLDPFFQRADVQGVIRTIETPHVPIPSAWSLLRDRPPYTVETEIALLAREGISHLVSKNAGGEATASKLVAARRAGIPVVMVARPEKPVCATVTSVAQAVDRLGFAA